MAHKIHLNSHVRKQQIPEQIADHTCENCPGFVTVFKIPQKHLKKVVVDCHKSEYPPPPLNKALEDQIIRDFCVDTSPSNFEESGCAVCGRLVQ
ncbi:hypothetical protein BDN72DRAFT_777825, partial [Pluteus cervinus]